MKVLVVGANGQIGKQLVHLLKNSEEHTIRAMVRKEEQAASFEKDGVETRLADLEGSVASITEAAKGCDAVVFAAGSGSHTGADKTILIDLDGAVKTIEATEKAGIKRFIMVSSILSNDREKWSGSHYMAAKYYADKFLEESSLDYTIIRPGVLTNEPGNNKITATTEKTDWDLSNLPKIPREDVARTIAVTLAKENTYKRAFDLISGNDEISEALAKIN
ncbi:SDR family oxidoreductase [Oceanobacillus sp. CAU 1775]